MQLTDLRTSFHGYNKEDVARLIGERDQRCASLEKELEELRARLAQKEKDAGQQPEEAIAEALISAQKFAAHTRAQASEETARMQERAKADADRLLAEARAEAERAHRQLEEELLEKKQEAVQVLAAAKQLRPDDPQFKGLSPIAAYRDNGLYKYTYGSSTDYEQTKQLRKDILDRVRRSGSRLIYAGLNAIGGMDEVLCDARQGISHAVEYLHVQARSSLFHFFSRSQCLFFYLDGTYSAQLAGRKCRSDLQGCIFSKCQRSRVNG